MKYKDKRGGGSVLKEENAAEGRSAYAVVVVIVIVVVDVLTGRKSVTTGIHTCIVVRCSVVGGKPLPESWEEYSYSIYGMNLYVTIIYRIYRNTTHSNTRSSPPKRRNMCFPFFGYCRIDR